MALIATAGAANANAYTTVAEATAFVEERLQTAPWFTEIDDQASLMERRAAALIWATQLLDGQVQWRGRPTTTTQALAWPQTGQVDPFGRPLDTVSIPVVVQRATALYALALMEDAARTTQSGGTASIKRKRIDDMEIEYWQASDSAQSTGTSMPEDIRQMLQPYGFVRGGLVVPLVRA